MTPKQKDLLDPFAWQLRLWERMISIMGDGELNELLDACKSTGSTNCWYHAFDAAKVLQPMVIQERAHRAEQIKRNLPGTGGPKT